MSDRKGGLRFEMQARGIAIGLEAVILWVEVEEEGRESGDVGKAIEE